MVASCPELLDGRGAIVDVGYGETPITTIELARAVQQVNAEVRVFGIERETPTAESQVRHVDQLHQLHQHSPSPRGGEGRGEGVTLLAGDFATCASLAPAAVVRAMNVLRGYREEEVEEIHAALGAGLVEGGLLLEGSTDTEGHVTVVWVMRKRSGALVREALLFHTDFTRGFSPWLFRDWLPRDLRRRAQPGTAIHSLLAAWDSQVPGDVSDARARFVASVRGGVVATAWEIDHGFARTVCPLPDPLPLGERENVGGVGGVG